MMEDGCQARKKRAKCEQGVEDRTKREKPLTIMDGGNGSLTPFGGGGG